MNVSCPLDSGMKRSTHHDRPFIVYVTFVFKVIVLFTFYFLSQHLNSLSVPILRTSNDGSNGSANDSILWECWPNGNPKRNSSTVGSRRHRDGWRLLGGIWQGHDQSNCVQPSTSSCWSPLRFCSEIPEAIKVSPSPLSFFRVFFTKRNPTWRHL